MKRAQSKRPAGTLQVNQTYNRGNNKVVKVRRHGAKVHVHYRYRCANWNRHIDDYVTQWSGEILVQIFHVNKHV